MRRERFDIFFGEKGHASLFLFSAIGTLLMDVRRLIANRAKRPVRIAYACTIVE
jgi:hypothetical protein